MGLSHGKLRASLRKPPDPRPDSRKNRQSPGNPTITDINQVRAARAKCTTDLADQIDLAIAVGLLCSAARIHLSAQHLLDTGRIEQAKRMTDAAELAHEVYREIMPAALSASFLVK